MQPYTVVVGLGKTGFSCVRHLLAQGEKVVLNDTREMPPFLVQCQNNFPAVKLVLGGLDLALLMAAEQVVVSPGVSLASPELVAAKKAGVSVVGDVELFARAAKAPIVAITGSNGKSTVTTLVGELLKAQNTRVAVGGNLGTPVLDLLDDAIQYYVLELSSFQLEGVSDLGAEVVTILNVGEDHLDRYVDFDAYVSAKQRIFQGATTVIFNRDDLNTFPRNFHGRLVSFGLSEPKSTQEHGLIEKKGCTYISKGKTLLITVNDLGVVGQHNWLNVLAALAILDNLPIDLDQSSVLHLLKTFKGLAHRCHLVRQLNGVDWINDSKATNVAAAVSSIRGVMLGRKGRLFWIAGGQGKGLDYSELQPLIAPIECTAVLIGEEAKNIAEVLGDSADCYFSTSLEDAVKQAYSQATSGDVVLLAPACASFDMFDNFEERGVAFETAVEYLG